MFDSKTVSCKNVLKKLYPKLYCYSPGKASTKTPPEVAAADHQIVEQKWWQAITEAFYQN